MAQANSSAGGPRAAEFFAGIGLMRLGLERAGWEVVFANDIAADKRTLYASCFPDADPHFVLGDIHALDPGQVPEVALATASFPCTDLSLAGRRRGLAGRESSAFWGFVRVLDGMRERRPPLVLLENVPGFLTSRGGQDLRDALRALNALGYAVDAFLINAAHFVPQSRVRLFIAGIQGTRPARGAFETEGPCPVSELRPKALAAFIDAHPDIDWTRRPLPPLPVCARPLDELLEDLPREAPEWWSKDRVDYLRSQMSPRHAARLAAMMAREDWSYGTVFRRVRMGRSMAELRTDGIAGCLRTPKGGSGRQILLKAGRGEARARLLTPRECARLMGADDFPVTGSLNQALFGFGDAVCVPVIEWIARHCFAPALAGRAAPAAAG